MLPLRTRSTHSQRLENWLGADQLAAISHAMRGNGDETRWYGKSIAVGNVPGKIFATKDGDFVGPLKAMGGWSLFEHQLRRTQKHFDNWVRKQKYQLNTGFSSLSDLISKASTGKRQEFFFQKVGTTGVVGVTNSLWPVGNLPESGAIGAAAPGGRATTKSTTGAFAWNNPSGSDTTHFVSGFPNASVGGNTLLLYDRIFDVAKTMNSTATEAVTGVPTRYQSQTATDQDYIGGNFLFVEVISALAATAHNWTTVTYTDQGGSASTLPSLTGNASAIVNRLDHPTSQWFAPLESGDVGIKTLTQMQCSAAVATGTVDFVIGHPIAWMPCPVANMGCIIDGINTAFSLTRIFDDACLSFLEVVKPATTATTYTGSFITVQG